VAADCAWLPPVAAMMPMLMTASARVKYVMCGSAPFETVAEC
jgi:hypothetical protein